MNNQVNVDEWVAMFRELGLDRGQMERWHQIFEARHPAGHQSFLQWLGATQEEIDQIRAKSR